MSTLQIGVLVAIVLLWLVLPRLGKTSSAEARKLVEAGARLIDVRSPGEFGGGHLPGAINIPVDQIGSRVAELKKSDKPIVLYCASGMRSGQAKRILAGAGIAGLHDLGAMSRW
jgi:rhodanese-related sulfurtransferase